MSIEKVRLWIPAIIAIGTLVWGAAIWASATESNKQTNYDQDKRIANLLEAVKSLETSAAITALAAKNQQLALDRHEKDIEDHYQDIRDIRDRVIRIESNQ